MCLKILDFEFSVDEQIVRNDSGFFPYKGQVKILSIKYQISIITGQ